MKLCLSPIIAAMNLLVIDKLLYRFKFSIIKDANLTVIVELNGSYPGADFPDAIIPYSCIQKTITNAYEGTSGLVHSHDSLVDLNFPRRRVDSLVLCLLLSS